MLWGGGEDKEGKKNTRTFLVSDRTQQVLERIKNCIETVYTRTFKNKRLSSVKQQLSERRNKKKDHQALPCFYASDDRSQFSGHVLLCGTNDSRVHLGGETQGAKRFVHMSRHWRKS